MSKIEPIYLDTRSEEEMIRDARVVQNISDKNIDLFSIQMSKKLKSDPVQKQKIDFIRKNSKNKQQMVSEIAEVLREEQVKCQQTENWYGKRRELKFEDGSFATCYDNFREGIEYKMKLPLFIISGMPSFLFEWKQLQTQLGNDFCRIIHWVVPGFDLIDERRGEYKGHATEVVELIKKSLDLLGFSKVIFGVHSFGLIIMNEFQNTYPEYTASTFQIGAPGIFPHKLVIDGYNETLQGFGTTHEELPENVDSFYEMVCDDMFRKQFLKMMAGRYNETTLTEIMAFMKINMSSKQGVNQNYYNYQNLPKKPRFIASGIHDIFIEANISEYTILFFNRMEGNYKIQMSEEQKKKFFQKCRSDKIVVQNFKTENFNFENIQSNFQFMFKDTGHVVHQRRAQELQVPLKTFFYLTETLEFDKLQPKL